MDNYINSDSDIQDLMDRVDAGYISEDDELERLAAQGRCPGCGQLPNTESDLIECADTGFHRQGRQNVEDEGDAPDPDDSPPSAPGATRDYSTIPDDLKRRGQWVAWKLEAVPDRDKPTKVPYSPRIGTRASTTDSLTWGSFDEAIAAYGGGDYDGIGFVMSSGDPHVFIDLDDAIDADDRAQLLPNGLDDSLAGLKPWADFVRTIASHAYVALSQSGTGLHVIIRGKLPACGRTPVERDDAKVGTIEMYDQKRFVALTGVTL